MKWSRIPVILISRGAAGSKTMLDVLHGRRKHLRSIVLIDLQTGLRKQELLTLRWQNVDFERDVIHV